MDRMTFSATCQSSNANEPAEPNEVKERTSKKAERFTESVIREMTRLATRYGAVNLAQGFPDFPAPEEMKRAACEAIQRDINQYSITWGAKSLREAIAERSKAYNKIDCDPESEVVVTCGATEAMCVAMLACVDPGEEIVVFEPFYTRTTAPTGSWPARIPSMCASTRPTLPSIATGWRTRSDRRPRRSSSTLPTIRREKCSRARSWR